MGTHSGYRVNPRNIRSVKDLRIEKMKLRMEILKTEERIKTNYRDIVTSLTPANILSTVLSDPRITSYLLSKVLSFGRKAMERRRRKKAEKERNR